MAQTAWACLSGWHEDPAHAFTAMQHFIAQHDKHKGDFRTQQQRVDHLQAALSKLQVESNPVAEIFRDQLADQLVEVLARPRPVDPDDFLDWLRWLNAPGGTRSVIDLLGVSQVPKAGHAAPLTDAELTKVFGTTKPTQQQVEPLASVLLNLRPAGHGTYIVVYADDEPAGYYFTGVTGT